MSLEDNNIILPADCSGSQVLRALYRTTGNSEPYSARRTSGGNTRNTDLKVTLVYEVASLGNAQLKVELSTRIYPNLHYSSIAFSVDRATIAGENETIAKDYREIPIGTFTQKMDYELNRYNV